MNKKALPFQAGQDQKRRKVRKKLSDFRITSQATFFRSSLKNFQREKVRTDFRPDFLLLVIYRLLLVSRSTTSWAPPSTMEVEEIRVSLACFCRSGMVRTPQLHMVERTLAREL